MWVSRARGRDRTLGLAWAAVLAVLLAGTAGCARDVAPEPRQSVLIERVPHVLQKPDFCGEAAAEMYLRARGHDVTQDQVFAAARIDPALGRGAVTAELDKALQRLGFRTGPVWYPIAADRAESQLDRSFGELYADLARGVPSIVCMHYDDQPQTTEHFRLVLGYDVARDEVVYHEPAEQGGAYLRMARAKFLSLWPLKYDARRWTVVRMRLEEGEEPRIPPDRKPSAADYAQHVIALRARVPESFAVAVEPPFVLVGNLGRAEVRAWAEGTVRTALRAFRKQYFAREPEQIIDVFLFGDSESYERYSRSLFGYPPHTPFGYYDDDHDALVMNISTGGGTLIHEIVHPYMRANFPRCPAWFNEGLASLYEGSRFREGAIYGTTNWRLAGLQQAIDAGEVPSLKALTATSDEEFYGDTTGVHYARARYLLHYLQERDLLQRYYREFVANRRSDPTGFATLASVLGRGAADMADFDRELDRYVLRLHYP